MTKQLRILLVEDDQIEKMKFNRAIKTLNLNCEVIVASDGEKALSLLKTNEILPDIVLLDLNMPRLNGIEMLKQIKHHKALLHIPVIILTTSSNPIDLLECYKAGIAGYMLKPLKYDDYISKISKIINYWDSSELISGVP